MLSGGDVELGRKKLRDSFVSFRAWNGESCLISGSASLLLRVVNEIVGEWRYYGKKDSSCKKNRARSEHGVNRLIASKKVFVERRGCSSGNNPGGVLQSNLVGLNITLGKIRLVHRSTILFASSYGEVEGIQGRGIFRLIEFC